MTVRVHVNQHVIRANQRSGTRNAPIAIRRGGKVEYAYEVELIGNARVVYRPDKPLKCGAKVWIEVDDARVIATQPVTRAGSAAPVMHEQNEGRQR